VVDGGGLENHCTRKGTGGSNPSLSAKSSGKTSIQRLERGKVRVAVFAIRNSKRPGGRDTFEVRRWYVSPRGILKSQIDPPDVIRYRSPAPTELCKTH
jgi:hypothetical protein